MMAGNVSAIFNNTAGGPLVLTGDGNSNQLSITQTSENSFRVQGLGTRLRIATTSGTRTVDSFTFRNVTDVTFNMNGGNDVIAFANATINGTLTVDMGTGNDTLSMVNIRENVLLAPTGLASVNMGSGNDTLVMTNFSSNADIAITAGSGRDSVTLSRVRAGDNGTGSTLSVDMGSGDHDALAVVLSSADTALFTDSGSNGVLSRVRNDFGTQTDTGFRVVS